MNKHIGNQSIWHFMELSSFFKLCRSFWMERFPSTSHKKEKQKNWKRKLYLEEQSEGQLDKKRRKMQNKLSDMANRENPCSLRTRRPLYLSDWYSGSSTEAEKKQIRINLISLLSFSHKVFMNSPYFLARSLRYFFPKTIAFKMFHFCQTSWTTLHIVL